MKRAWTLLLLLVVCNFGCESNPLGRDDITNSGRRLSGQVLLDRNPAKADVVVWLDGFDVTTRTDRNGRFKLTLPPPSEIGRVSGAFKVFYYLANFSLASTDVRILNGGLLLPSAEINEQGELRDPALLLQKLRVETRVRPEAISRSRIQVTNGLTNLIIRVDVLLQAVRVPVEVYFPPLVDGNFGPLMFRNTSTNEVSVLQSTLAGFMWRENEIVGPSQTIRTMVVPIFPDDLQVGEYEVIPFLLVKNDGLPEGLRDRLRLATVKPGPDYLNIPILRTGASRILKVLE